MYTDMSTDIKNMLEDYGTRLGYYQNYIRGMKYVHNVTLD